MRAVRSVRPGLVQRASVRAPLDSTGYAAGVSLTRKEMRSIRSLRTRRGREGSGRFLAEGVRVLEAASKSGTAPVLLVHAPELSARAQALADASARAGVRVERVEAKALESLADTRSPQGIIAVFELPRRDLSDPVFSPPPEMSVIADGVSDPGNLGTLLRSALAFDAGAMICAGGSADPWSPKVVRASAGAVFELPVARTSHEALLEWLGLGDVRLIIAGSARRGAALPPFDAGAAAGGRRGAAVALAVGSEGEGVSAALEGRASACWTIETHPAVESLNAAVAGSILLEKLREWRRRQEPP